MSIEKFRGYTFRYVHDRTSPGKVKVYVEKGIDPKTKHLIPGKPPYICFKENHKPSTYSNARSLARKWANMNRR